LSDENSPSAFELYKIALDTRNMEISLFWQRSNYFLALNTAAAVGFFLKAGEDYQILIGAFGICISLLWIAVNLGSKFWQSRWEGRLHKAEQFLNENSNTKIEYFSASWDVIKADVKESIGFSNHNFIRRGFDHLVLLKPSVSFTMTLLSILFLLLWTGLVIMSFCPEAQSINTDNEGVLLCDILKLCQRQ
jgi:hypothetical protein